MFRFYQFVGKDTYNYPYRLELEESFGIINDFFLPISAKSCIFATEIDAKTCR